MKRITTAGLIIALSLSLMPVGFAADANPYGGVKVPPPSPTETILTIQKGSISKNISMKDLMAMKSSTLTINEPFVKKVQKFQAVPLSIIFAYAGIKGSDKVETIALNDYIYTNTAASFLAADGYLAFTRSGNAIGYDEGGPIRIIFPDKSKWAHFLDPWNWSLKSLKVK
jgi:hypothetical protein